MAVVCKSLGKIDDMWNEWAPTIRAIFADEDKKNVEYDNILEGMFNVETSNRFGEKSATSTEFADFEITGEGNDGEEDDFEEGFAKLIEHEELIKTLTITKAAIEDSKENLIRRKASNFIEAYKRSRLNFATKMLTAEGTTFDFGKKKSLDRTTGDGKALFATDHPGKKAGVAAQCNVFTNAFGTDAKMLTRLANIGKNFKNDSGNVMGYTFDTIIIPSNCWEMEDTIKKIIRTDLMVGSQFNDANTQKGLWNLIVNPLWQAAEGKNPYIIMSSKANKALDGSAFFDRTPLNILEEQQTKNHNMLYSGRCRFGAGFYNWRHVIMGGATEGQTLV